MTQEEKSLLLKDLCAKLPYNVKCKVHLDTKGYCLRDEDKYCDDTLESVNCKKQTCTFNKSIGYNFGYFAIEEVKPYLRPMSSMTKEELHEVQEILGKGVEIRDVFISIVDSSINSFTYLELQAVFDWLRKNHFDFMGLIPKNLALEAPEGMYNLNK